ncbi:hypothetical protein ACSBR2_025186 [Camellia fascicularis]
MGLNYFIDWFYLLVPEDGSCNGPQHYAALGRDALEAAAVNLVAGEKPADVYSEIAARVHDIMVWDSNKDPATSPNALLAKLLIGQVDRKLVQQTVMTSVYGVTYVGAREQIKRRLEEKGQITDDGLLFNAACYAAKVTISALGEIFEAARAIMGWLGDCAKIIASENQPVRWTTPLGLPVVQPYIKTERHVVEVRKQRTALPPNFVHSLDGSHMMMTAVACRDAGLRFAGVHDSFWTHACDVDRMNRIIREKLASLSLPFLFLSPNSWLPPPPTPLPILAIRELWSPFMSFNCRNNFRGGRTRDCCKCHMQGFKKRPNRYVTVVVVTAARYGSYSNGTEIHMCKEFWCYIMALAVP